MGVAVSIIYMDLLFNFFNKDSQCQVSVGVACYNSEKHPGIHSGLTVKML